MGNSSVKELIRKARINDIPALQEIRAAVKENILSDPSKVTTEDYIKFITKGLIWVWDEKGTIKGFSAGDTSDGWIWALFVDPNHERQGIGQALFPLACEDLFNAGHQTITLSTDPDTRAAHFYLADGWIIEQKNEKNELVMKKHRE